MAERSFDVVIIGGGVIGSAVACFLAAEDAFDGTIAVVEKDPSYRRCSTSLSAGGIRQQFSGRENIQISLFGAHFLKHLDRYLAVEGRAPDVGFVENGYLFLATQAGRDVLARNHALQTECGADVSLLPRDELATRFPWLNVSDLAAGAVGESGEGWLDPYGLLQAFKRKAQSLGVTYLHDEVAAMRRQGGRIEVLTLTDGSRLVCGAVVNAAGTRAAQVARMAGIDDLPVHGRKRCVFMFEAATNIERCPLMVDPSGAYFRPEGSGFIGGIAPEPDPDCDDFDVDATLFEEVLWPILAQRVPAFEALRPGAAWAGHYAYNVIDQNAILGPHPEVANFMFANGFSGHGLQQSPAVGRYISELITFGAPRTLDLGALAYTRFAGGGQAAEINVV